MHPRAHPAQGSSESSSALSPTANLTLCLCDYHTGFSFPWKIQSKQRENLDTSPAAVATGKQCLWLALLGKLASGLLAVVSLEGHYAEQSLQRVMGSCWSLTQPAIILLFSHKHTHCQFVPNDCSTSVKVQFTPLILLVVLLSLLWWCLASSRWAVSCALCSLIQKALVIQVLLSNMSKRRPQKDTPSGQIVCKVGKGALELGGYLPMLLLPNPKASRMVCQVLLKSMSGVFW